MKLVESNGFSDSSRLQASQMLHGDNYHQAKRDIMRRVSEFQALVDTKSLRELERAYAQSQVAMYAIVILTLLAIYFFHKEFQSKRHDGRIWIESPPLGEEKGTAVSFELPVDRSECGA